LKDKGKFAPWLAAICRNIAKDMAAARNRQRQTEDISQVPDNKDCDSDGVILFEAVNRLPEPYRELIFLRYYDNASYEQIGSILGVSAAAVNGRLIRAKRKLAKYLKQNGFEDYRL
jgi:RNA polymerase sigma-70 factor (ECF subfamily)